MYYGLGYGLGPFMMGFNVLFFLVTLGLILWMFRGSEREKNSRTSPEDILKRRLAWGEIDEKEYLRLKKIIETKE